MSSPTLFRDIADFDLETQGIKYIGSKKKLLKFILQMAHKVGAKKILDGFSGTTRVSQAFARNNFEVVSNDIAVWSKAFGQCYLLANKPINYYQEIIEHLNALPPVDGWFTQHYGGERNGGSSVQKNGEKKPWQRHNTRKLDAVREEIDKLNINDIDKSVVLTSLMLALDKVDNTLGHYVSYLKDWSLRSYNTLFLEVPKLISSHHSHKVLNEEVFKVVNRENVDLAYFDPPYGSNNEKMPPSRVRYASYYHIWKTICLNDKSSLFGQAKRRSDSSDKISYSVFEDYRKEKSGKFLSVEAIEKLIKSTKAPFIILSYSSGGRATAEELNSILNNNGKVKDIVQINYKKNIMSEMKWTNDWVSEITKQHKEFLFLLEK